MPTLLTADTITGEAIASQAEAQAGVATNKIMTPARTADAINALASGVPAGSIIYVAMSTAPTGYLKANGAAVSRTVYSALFSSIGTTFGSGDGSTTFNLPDLRGEFIRGWDDSRGVDSGRAFGSAQSSQNLSHTHSVSGSTSTGGAHSHTQIYYQQTTSIGQSATGANNAGAATANYLSTSTGSSGSHSHTISGTADASGGTEARPRNVAVLACIKY